jgi:hypothetical protein
VGPSGPNPPEVSEAVAFQSADVSLDTRCRNIPLPMNEVVLNQVVVAFGDDDRTRRVIASIQDAGECWCGGTIWKGRAAMRISVSSCATTDEDVERSVRAILDALRGA